MINLKKTVRIGLHAERRVVARRLVGPNRAIRCVSPAVALFYNVLVDSLRHLGQILLLLGAFLAAVGALLYFTGRLPLRLGHLPGGITYRGGPTTFYFPIVTCFILSVAVSLLFWLFSLFRR